MDKFLERYKLPDFSTVKWIIVPTGSCRHKNGNKDKQKGFTMSLKRMHKNFVENIYSSILGHREQPQYMKKR